MCVGKTSTEIVKTCTSTCKNFARCTARLEALNEQPATNTSWSKALDNRSQPIPTTSRTMLVVVK